MNEPTEAQKEFWEWCGLLHYVSPLEKIKYEDNYWITQSGTVLTAMPSIDLNNLFKYAVPKLIDRYGGILLILPQSDIKSWECKILNSPGSEATFGYGDSPALALFWAIYKVMEAERNG